jgi:hypothetical protein
MGISILWAIRAPLALAFVALAAAPALAQTRTSPTEDTRRYNQDIAPPATSGSALEAPAPGVPGSTALADLTGTWRGAYSYSNPGRPVEFVLTLEVAGGACHGRTEEPNTFGHPSAPKLFANIQCSLTTGPGPPRLAMRKVYDGTGGQSHGVDYVGELSADGRSITGTWSLAGSSGRFTLSTQ